MRTTCFLAFALTFAACSVSRPEQAIGPAGGVLTSSDGKLRVVIPPGALDDTHRVGVTLGASVPLSSTARVVGPSYTLTPSGLALAAPATAIFQIAADAIPSGGTAAVFVGAPGLAPESAEVAITDPGEIQVQVSSFLQLQVVAIVASSCRPIGQSCRTSQDCCASTCNPEGLCTSLAPADGGVCSPASGACTSDGACCSGRCNADVGLCLNGFPIDCASTEQCPAGTICRQCLAQCLYPAQGYCDSSAPCDCGFSCQDHVCIPTTVNAGAPGCHANGDCPNDQACNPFTGQCQFPMCSGIAGQALADGGVLAPIACTPEKVGSTCSDGLICTFIGEPGLEFACLQPCDDSTDCAVGFCSYGPVHVCGFDCTLYCNTNADCPQGQGTFCENGACVNEGC